jgi:hypothetical protein
MTDMNRTHFTRQVARATTTAAILGAMMTAVISTALADRAGHAPDAIWVHDEIYSTIGTDTAFKSPPPHSTDVIFSFANSGLEGQRSVAEYAPGDPEYNGGRWNVMAVTFTEMGLEAFDEDGDGVIDFEYTNAEEVLADAEMGLLTIEEAGVYFECPLLRNNKGRKNH